MMDKRNLDFANELLEVSKDDLKRSKRDYVETIITSFTQFLS